MQLKKHHCKPRINQSINHNYHLKIQELFQLINDLLNNYDQQDFPFMPNIYTYNLWKCVAVSTHPVGLLVVVRLMALYLQ
jgi:hypothetical protein